MLKLGESRSRCRLLGDHYQTYWSIMRTMNILSLVFFIIHCQHYDQVSRVIYDKDPVTTMCTNCRTTVTTIVTAEVNTHYQHRNHSHFHHHNNVHLHCCLDRLVWSPGLLQGLAVLQVISSSVKKNVGSRHIQALPLDIIICFRVVWSSLLFMRTHPPLHAQSKGDHHYTFDFIITIVTLTVSAFVRQWSFVHFPSQDVTHKCPNCNCVMGRHKAKLGW